MMVPVLLEFELERVQARASCGGVTFFFWTKAVSFPTSSKYLSKFYGNISTKKQHKRREENAKLIRNAPRARSGLSTREYPPLGYPWRS